MSEFSAERAPPYPEMIQLFPGVIEVVGEPPTDWLALFRSAGHATRDNLRRACGWLAPSVATLPSRPQGEPILALREAPVARSLSRVIWLDV